MIEMGQKVDFFVCCDYKDAAVLWMLFGLVSKAEMIILSMFFYVVRKRGNIYFKKKHHITILYIQIPASSGLQKSSAQRRFVICTYGIQLIILLTFSPSFSMKCMELFPFCGTRQSLNVERYKKHHCLDLHPDTTTILEKRTHFWRLNFAEIESTLELLVHLQCLWALVVHIWAKSE